MNPFKILTPILSNDWRCCGGGGDCLQVAEDMRRPQRCACPTPRVPLTGGTRFVKPLHHNEEVRADGTDPLMFACGLRDPQQCDWLVNCWKISRDWPDWPVCQRTSARAVRLMEYGEREEQKYEWNKTIARKEKPNGKIHTSKTNIRFIFDANYTMKRLNMVCLFHHQ